MSDSQLRAEFVRLLTEDSPHNDRRRRDHNQAIFIPPDDPNFPGHAIWTSTDLDMVMDKFDKAMRNVNRTTRTTP